MVLLNLPFSLFSRRISWENWGKKEKLIRLAKGNTQKRCLMMMMRRKVNVREVKRAKSQSSVIRRKIHKKSGDSYAFLNILIFPPVSSPLIILHWSCTLSMLNNDEERDSQEEEDEGRMTTTFNQQRIYTETEPGESVVYKEMHTRNTRTLHVIQAWYTYHDNNQHSKTDLMTLIRRKETEGSRRRRRRYMQRKEKDRDHDEGGEKTTMDYQYNKTDDESETEGRKSRQGNRVLWKQDYPGICHLFLIHPYSLTNCCWESSVQHFKIFHFCFSNFLLHFPPSSSWILFMIQAEVGLNMSQMLMDPLESLYPP